MTTFVSAIFDKQTGCQAELARTQGNQEAACKRLSRLIHNERLSPKWLAESIAHQALSQVPPFGKVRLTIDWATEDEQHLLTVSLVIGRRAVPIYWRAYHQSVLKGRMHLYERAVIKRAFFNTSNRAASGSRRIADLLTSRCLRFSNNCMCAL
ncbi:MAG TPA: hypothetical protein VG324_18205 [Blastocatellia bacterium]|nr:hypothetical protein [Blastocatellia bacterium]